MRKLLLLLITISLAHFGSAQEPANKKKQQLLKEISEGACKCIDSIDVYDKDKQLVVKEVNTCIDDRTSAYMLGAMLAGLDLSKAEEDKDGKKTVNLELNMNKDSKQYKDAYYELERYLMENCAAVKNKIATNDKQSDFSISNNREARMYYDMGIEASKKEDYKGAVEFYKKALEIDSKFAFAWDNLGISYRRLGQYDDALNAYKKSLEIDPYGRMPLQNIAIVYQYKKDFPSALKAYERLAEVDSTNPEVFYGIGQICALQLEDYEKGLDNMCKAYNIYTSSRSPYRTDAEKIIQHIYQQMKKQGKEEKFMEIMQANNIKVN